MDMNAFAALIETRGLTAALEALTESGGAQDVAEAFDDLLRDTYWKRKDIVMVVALAQAGMAFCLRHADAATNEAARSDFLSAEKVLAYNLGSFTWPGWDEPGIALTPALVALGLTAARRNLELAIALQKPIPRLRDAHWLVGAQLLAASHAGHLEEAQLHFQKAASLLNAEARNEDQWYLAPGYVLLAECLLKRDQALSAWQAYLVSLKAQGEPTAAARDQLVAAGGVFLPKA